MGLKAIRLESGDGMTATFVPEAGMIAVSLTAGGEELLGQRHGIESYIESGKTMGIPLLHPWANRLAADHYEFAGQQVDLAADAAGVRRDENGLPIHGNMAADPHWVVEEAATGERLEWAGLKASFDYGARPELLASFPFPHRIEIEILLAGSTLEVKTRITATGDLPVPLAFGFHPYISLPESDRAGWTLELPEMEALELDGRGIPDGKRRPSPASREPLGDTAWDHAFAAVPEGAVFAVEDGRWRVEVSFDEGFPAAQVFAPPAENVVCFEPMKAPANTLAGGEDLTAVEPGESRTSRFAVTAIDLRRSA